RINNRRHNPLRTCIIWAIFPREHNVVVDRPTAENLATPKFVIAESGDTLWAIAQRIAPNSDITEVVDQLVLMNGDQITTGQLVRIP
ncbi:MAG: hypothetical protein ACKO8F_04600, partial [Acidimicrobiaceae bacterium]